MSEGDTASGYDAARAEAEAWLRAHWDPDRSVRAWWALLAESGWGFPTWPPEWFGRGLDPQWAGAVREAFAAVGALGPPSSLGQLLGGPTLLTHGSEEQKRQFLPRLATGEEFWCQLFSEPAAGSDLASLRTRAVRDGDEWVVNGQKVWTSGAQWADRGMLLARTDPDVEKHRGLTYFVIDIDQPGIEVRPLHQMNGAHGFNEVFFTDARVGAGRVVGEVGGGWAVALTTLSFERFMVAFGAAPGRKAGLLDTRAGDVASGAVSGPRQFAGGFAAPASLVRRAASELGRTGDPLVRQGLAEATILEEIQRYAALRSAAAVRAGRRPGAEGSVRKLARSVLVRRARDVGMAALGPFGTLVGPDTPGGGAVQQLCLSSPGTSIAGGTDEIQRTIVGERVLGLPREPRVDRDVSFRELEARLAAGGRGDPNGADRGVRDQDREEGVAR